MSSTSPTSETVSRLKSSRSKVALRLALLVIVGVAGLTVLLGFGSLLSSVTRSGQSAAVFTDAAELPDELLDAVTWLPDDASVSVPVSPLTRLDITSSWIRAWSQLAVVAETGDTSGMEVYFSDAALAGVLRGAEQAAGRPVYQISHDLQVSFLSEDQQVLGLTASNSRFIRAEPFDDGHRRFFATNESYEAVLVLEDGNWRIHHWVRRSVDGDWLVGSDAPATSVVLAELGIAGEPVDFLLADMPEQPGSVDPASSLPFADESDQPVPPVSPELSRRIATAFDQWEFGAAGSKVVRLPLSSHPVLTPGTIREVLDVAQDRGFSVIIAPFDGRTDFAPSRWDADRRHLESVRTEAAGHPAVVSIELVASPDGQSDLAQAWQVWLSGPLISLSDQ